jgi:hypothetical protein
MYQLKIKAERPCTSHLDDGQGGRGVSLIGTGSWRNPGHLIQDYSISRAEMPGKVKDDVY